MLDPEPQFPPQRGRGQCQTKASRTRHLHPEVLTPSPSKLPSDSLPLPPAPQEAFCESLKSMFRLRGHVGALGPRLRRTGPLRMMSQGRGRWRVTKDSPESRELVNGTRAEAPRLRKPTEWAGAAVAVDQVAREEDPGPGAVPVSLSTAYTSRGIGGGPRPAAGSLD